MDTYDGGVPVAVIGSHALSGVVSDPLSRVIWRIGAPAVASNLLMIVFASADAFWVGTRLGPEALAAVATSLFWIWLVVSIAEMVGIGLTAVAARRHGERRPEEAARVVGEALFYAVGLGTVVAVLGVVLLPWLLGALHNPPGVQALGARYLGTYLMGMPLIFGFFAVDAAFRASGDTRTPMIILGSSVLMTLVLDPVLILGRFGIPALGITGAAVATISTRGGAFLLGTALLFRRRMVRLGPIRRASLAAITRVGLPTAITGVAFSAIYVAVTRTVTQFGTPALAAMGLGFRVESWMYMVGVGFGAAAAAIVGQNLGARQPDRAARAGWITVGYGTLLSLIAVVIELTIPAQLAGIFTRDPAVIQETAHYLRIAALAQLFTAAEIVLEGALGGAGETLPPMIMSTSISALRIPLAAWAATQWGTTGIWAVISVTAAGRGIGMAILWRLGRWKHRSV
ncbi:MAG: MATE family efflux transporter [Gemmatimonadales bacterium]